MLNDDEITKQKIEPSQRVKAKFWTRRRKAKEERDEEEMVIVVGRELVRRTMKEI